MKKVLISILFLFTLTACQEKQAPIVDIPSGIVTIDEENLKEKIENNHRFILYIGRSDCKDCIELYPQLEAFMNDHPSLGIYALDVKAFRDRAFRDDATPEEKAFFDELKTYLNFDWTPTLQYRQGSRILSKITYLDTESQGTKKEKKESMDAIKQWLIDIDFK